MTILGALRQVGRRLAQNPAGAPGRGQGSFCEDCPKLYATPPRLGDWEAG